MIDEEVELFLAHYGIFVDPIGEEVEDFLAHYGVRGMKWGVRKQRESGTAGSGSGAGAVLAVYAGLIGVAVASQATARYRDSGRKDAKKTGTKEFKVDKSLTGKKTVSQLESQVVKPINPGYGEPGTQMNCRRATMAYEMRRRGYDVKATKSKYASGQGTKGLKSATSIDKKEKLESVWGEKKISNIRELSTSTPQKKAELIFDALGSNPNGARGELGVAWTMGGGHSIAWEVVNKKPVIFDTQNGKTYKNAKEFSEFTPVVYDAAQTRLDNKPINPEFIKRWVTDV